MCNSCNRYDVRGGSAGAASIINTQDGISYVSEAEEIKIENLGASTLSTPKNLKWHETYSSGKKTTIYGSVAWDAVPNCEGEYEIKIFRNGTQIYKSHWSDMYDHSGIGRLSVSANNMKDVFTQSGSYTFSVKAIGDETRYSDSAAATSSAFNFTLPSARLAQPQILSFDNGVVRHTLVSGAWGYRYEIYDQYKEKQGTMSGISFAEGSTNDEDLSWYLQDLAADEWLEYEITKFYVKVTALTGNITEAMNSNPSAYSPAYTIGENKNHLSDKLDNVLNDNTTAQEALDSYLNYMDNNNYTNTDMAISMAEDEEFTEKISELEIKYQNENGISVNISDNAESSTYLEDRGIDVSKVSIVGAALNSENNKNVSLNFSEADPSLSKDTLFYKNSVAVNIDMEGVTNSQDLKIPVKIIMPVPFGVLAERLMIMHHHKDGTVEKIHPEILDLSGEYYASFVLTSFSDFVFCNENDIDLTNLTDVAADIGDVYLPKNTRKLEVPYLPENFKAEVIETSDGDIIDMKGNVALVPEDINVSVKLRITDINTGAYEDTNYINVTVPMSDIVAFDRFVDKGVKITSNFEKEAVLIFVCYDGKNNINDICVKPVTIKIGTHDYFSDTDYDGADSMRTGVMLLESFGSMRPLCKSYNING